MNHSEIERDQRIIAEEAERRAIRERIKLCKIRLAIVMKVIRQAEQRSAHG